MHSLDFSTFSIDLIAYYSVLISLGSLSLEFGTFVSAIIDFSKLYSSIFSYDSLIYFCGWFSSYNATLHDFSSISLLESDFSSLDSLLLDFSSSLSWFNCWASKIFLLSFISNSLPSIYWFSCHSAYFSGIDCLFSSVI